MAQDSFKLAKIDHDKRQVFGWANVSVRKTGEVIVDRHDHVIPIDVLENAAYDFALHYRDAGANHEEGYLTGKMIESFVVTKEKLQKMGLKPDALPQGWWIGFQIDDDDAWDRIKKGDYEMFSIEGQGFLETVE